ncbi:mutator-like element, partial [Colletotrichum chrysophilum]
MLLDCTYKTNKYGMPLLDIVGVDACQRSFCIAFAFLSGEAEDDYTWALERVRSLYDQCNARLPAVVLTDRCLACINAVAAIFPSSASLLCLWHANKAVLQHCSSAFDLAKARTVSASAAAKSSAHKREEFYKSWHSIVGSPSEVIFEE